MEKTELVNPDDGGPMQAYANFTGYGLYLWNAYHEN